MHLGSDFSVLDRKAGQRRKDLAESFQNIINYCSEEDIDLILMAGDLFESWQVSDSLFDMVKDGFERIPNTKVIISAGNHDPATSDSLYKKKNYWSDNVYILENQFHSIVFHDIQAEVWGASFSSPYVHTSIFGEVSPQQPDYIQLGVIHGTLTTGNQSSEYNPVSNTSIETSGLEYLALGHIHKPSEIKTIGKTTVAYSGSAEGLGFDELGERGFITGKIGKNMVDVSLKTASLRQYLEVDVDISQANTNSDVSKIILKSLKEKFGSNYNYNLYKIYLVGEISEDLTLNTDNISAELSQLFYFKLRDNTRLKIDLHKASQENSLKGFFVKNMMSLLESDDNETAQEALKIGLKAFYGEVGYSEN